MKNELRNYFYDRLSIREEAKMQQYICENSDSKELDDALRGLFDECAEAAERQSRRHFPGFAKVLPYALAAAAALALVIFLPITYKNGKTEGENRIAAIEWVEVNVPYGESRSVTMCDGTVLHLAAGSRLTYPKEFTGDSRTVFMDGEAYLDVTKNPEHPFVIKSQDLDIKVLGTSFSFRNFAQERSAEVLLVSGSVEASVSTAGQPRVVRLKPGDKLRYNRADGKIDIDRFSASSYKAFYKNNSLHFYDVEMADIAAELSRRFDCQVVVTDEKLASRRYFSIFTNNETLDEILSAMNTDNKMRIRRSGDIIYLQSR